MEDRIIKIVLVKIARPHSIRTATATATATRDAGLMLCGTCEDNQTTVNRKRDTAIIITTTISFLLLLVIFDKLGTSSQRRSCNAVGEALGTAVGLVEEGLAEEKEDAFVRSS